MRIDSAQALAAMQLKSRNVNIQSNPALDRLSPGDVIDAEVVATDKNSMALKLADGSVVVAARELPIPVAQGDIIKLTVTGRQGNQLLAQLTDIPAALLEKGDLPTMLKSLGLEPNAKNTEILQQFLKSGVVPTKSEINNVSDMLSAYKSLTPEKAVFMLNNKIPVNSSNIAMLDQFLAHQNSIGSKLDKLISLLSQDGDGNPEAALRSPLPGPGQSAGQGAPIPAQQTAQVPGQPAAQGSQPGQPASVIPGQQAIIGTPPGQQVPANPAAVLADAADATSTVGQQPTASGQAAPQTAAQQTGVMPGTQPAVPGQPVPTAVPSELPTSPVQNAQTLAALGAMLGDEDFVSLEPKQLQQMQGQQAQPQTQGTAANPSAAQQTAQGQPQAAAAQSMAAGQQAAQAETGGSIPQGQPSPQAAAQLVVPGAAQTQYGQAAIVSDAAAATGRDAPSPAAQAQATASQTAHPAQNTAVPVNVSTSSDLKSMVESLFRQIEHDRAKFLPKEIAASRLNRQINEVLAAVNEHLPEMSSTQRMAVTQIVNEIDQSMKFINQLSNTTSVIQIPILINDQKSTAELYVFQEGKKSGKKIDPRNATMFVSLATVNLNRIDAYVRIIGNNVECDIRADGEETVQFVAANALHLSNLLEANGYRLSRVTFSESEEDQTMLDAREERRQDFRKFGFDVTI